MGVSRPTFSGLLNSKSNISGDMALHIERAFGVKMDTLMRIASSYDIARTRKREKEIGVRRVPDLATTHQTSGCQGSIAEGATKTGMLKRLVL
jgi:plasmid maintenance system antidote protein VapI